MGCCGCTLQTSAIVAAVFGIIQSVAGFLTGILFLERTAELLGLSASVNVLLSATLFNALWLIATIVLIIGIVKENAVMHRVWVGVTSVVMVADLAHSIVLTVGFIQDLSYSTSFNYVRTSGYNYYDSYGANQTGVPLYLLLITAVSRGIWLWVVNICLTIYTAHRANEIERGPLPSGQTVFVYGNQPTHTYAVPGQISYALPGSTIIIQQGFPSTAGMPPTYNNQQPQYGQQYGQQPPPQYGQAPVDPSDQGKGMPPMH